MKCGVGYKYKLQYFMCFRFLASTEVLVIG